MISQTSGLFGLKITCNGAAKMTTRLDKQPMTITVRNELPKVYDHNRYIHFRR